MTYLGCIADDFTGATDLAALLARSNIPVSLRIGTPEKELGNGPTAPIEIIALKCRSTPAEEAVRDTRKALAWLQNAGAERFFWKYCSTFDSTKEGNIGPVAEALMEDLGVTQTVYCPSFPENGRSVYMGNLFVNGQPLAESPMKDHPLNPMRDSNLMRLLEPQVCSQVGLAAWPEVAAGPRKLKKRIRELADGGVAHVVVDAICDTDLRTVAAATMDMNLVTGGSAVAAPLPDLMKKAGLFGSETAAWPAPRVGGGMLTLSGSCSAMTRQQVDDYLPDTQSYRLDPITLAREGVEGAVSWLRSQSPEAPKLIYATAEPAAVREAQEQLGVKQAGELLENAMAVLAKSALDLGVRRFLVAGGETSGAVTSHLGVSHLQIGAEIAPGVPWTYSVSNGVPIALALKSGNFGGKGFFKEAWTRLGA